MLLTALSTLGRHARLALPAGIGIALILPDIPLRWDIILPLNITLIYAASMIRLDLKSVGLAALAPQRLALSVSVAGFILCLVPIFYAGIAHIGGLSALYLRFIWEGGYG